MGGLEHVELLIGGCPGEMADGLAFDHAAHLEGVADIPFPVGCRQADLGLGPANPAQVVHREGYPPLPGEHAPEELGLVEPPLPQPLEVKRHRDDEIGPFRLDEVGKAACGQEPQGAGQMDLRPVLEAVDQLLHRAIETERGPRRRERPAGSDAWAAGVVSALLRGERKPADRTQGGADPADLFSAPRADMDLFPARDEGPADVTEGRKERVEEGPEKHGSEPHILVHHQHAQVGILGLPLQHRDHAADPLRRVAVGAEAGEGAGGLVVQPPGIGGRGPFLHPPDRCGRVAVHQLVAASHHYDLARAEKH